MKIPRIVGDPVLVLVAAVRPKPLVMLAVADWVQHKEWLLTHASA